MLKKYTTEPLHVIDYDPLPLRKDLSYKEQPTHILSRWEAASRLLIDFLYSPYLTIYFHVIANH